MKPVGASHQRDEMVAGAPDLGRDRIGKGRRACSLTRPSVLTFQNYRSNLDMPVQICCDCLSIAVPSLVRAASMKAVALMPCCLQDALKDTTNTET